jgi:hypothetical protein
MPDIAVTEFVVSGVSSTVRIRFIAGASPISERDSWEIVAREIDASFVCAHDDMVRAQAIAAELAVRLDRLADMRSALEAEVQTIHEFLKEAAAGATSAAN